MKPLERQKMCANCDGRVSVELLICPYCSADLSKNQAGDLHRNDSSSRNQAIQDSLTNLYTPPYKAKKNEAIRSTPKETRLESRIVPPAHHGGMAVAPGSLPRDETEDKIGKTVLASILALSIGSILFIIGLLQVFFSEQGVLKLEWSTDYWFIYALASIPLLYFGYKKAE